MEIQITGSKIVNELEIESVCIRERLVRLTVRAVVNTILTESKLALFLY